MVVVGITTTDPGPYTVKDSNNNAYVSTPKTPFTGGAVPAGIYYLKNAPANAAAAVTITGSGAANFYSIFVAEFTGADTTSPFENDATAANASGGTTINTPSITPSNNNDLLFAVSDSNNGISSANSPWTGVSTVPASGDYAEYLIQGTAAAQAVNFTQIAGSYDGIVATFKVASSALVASWYSPFEEPKRLKAVPAGFAGLPTNIATVAAPPKQFQPFFDPVRPIPRPAGFVDHETNIQTVAQPIRVFPPFDPPATLKKVPPGFVDLELASAAAATPAQTFAPFDGPARLRRQTDWQQLPVAQSAAPITLPPWQTFDLPMRLRQPTEWQQSPVTTIAVPAPPVFALSPPFDPPARLRGLKVLETGFAYSPQVIVQINPVIAAVHDHPLFATMGRLMSRR